MNRPSAILNIPPAHRGVDLPIVRVVMSPVPMESGRQTEDTKPLDNWRLVLTDELKAEIQRESARLESAEPEEILRWVTERFAPRFTMATAFGPEGMVLIHMLA